MLSYIIELKSPEGNVYFLKIIFIPLTADMLKKEGGRDYESEGLYQSLQRLRDLRGILP